VSSTGYTTVLVGTDGSESSFRAVDRAALVARDTGATLLLLTAYRPMNARDVQDAGDALGEEAYKVSGSTPAEGVLRDAADRAAGLGATKVETLAVAGDPASRLICRVAQSHRWTDSRGPGPPKVRDLRPCRVRRVG